jgi:hypothetical protein
MLHLLDTNHKEKYRNFLEAIRNDGLEVHKTNIHSHLQPI